MYLPHFIPKDALHPAQTTAVLHLDIIFIGFDTDTFDKVDRDIRNTPETQIALFGGTFGLFTGFSILSGVEIVYFALKYLLKKLKNVNSAFR